MLAPWGGLPWAIFLLAATSWLTVVQRILHVRKQLIHGGTSGNTTNGRARLDDGKVRVAIIGVGNCANSLLQGREYYKDAPDDQFVPGLMHVNLGGYHIRDIEFTAAFDVVKGKVGEDLADAMWAHPNDTIKFADVPKTGIKVSRGMTHDGLGKYLSQVVEKAPGETADIVGILKETKTDVVVNYLPVGSETATKWYAEQILEAGCAMVNCMPVFIAREDYWNKRFQDAGVPIIGDDIKSQVGATITHRVLTSLFRERGVHLDKTMQLNVGGNSDFLNMLERERLESKKISKTNAVTSMLDYDLGAGNVHVGPSDYVPWLTDRKWAYIRMEGSSFGDVPLNVELKLEVWDSPNSAGIVIDAVRLAKLALNNGVAGSLVGPSSYLMKSPPQQIQDDEAHELTEEFIERNKRVRPSTRPRRRSGMTSRRCRRSPASPALVGSSRPLWPAGCCRLTPRSVRSLALAGRARGAVQRRVRGLRRPVPPRRAADGVHGQRVRPRPRRVAVAYRDGEPVGLGESRPARRGRLDRRRRRRVRGAPLGRRRGAHARAARAGARARRAAGLARGDRREHRRPRPVREARLRARAGRRGLDAAGAEGEPPAARFPVAEAQAQLLGASTSPGSAPTAPSPTTTTCGDSSPTPARCSSACARRRSCSSTQASPSLCFRRSAPSGRLHPQPAGRRSGGAGAPRARRLASWSASTRCCWSSRRVLDSIECGSRSSHRSPGRSRTT